GEDDDLESAGGGEIQHPLKGVNALRVGEGEGVIEDDGQASVVIVRQNLRHREAGRRRDLFLRASTERGELECRKLRANKLEAFDSVIGNVDANPGSRPKDAPEVAGDAIGERLNHGPADIFARGQEQIVQESDGTRTALLGGVEVAGE